MFAQNITNKLKLTRLSVSIEESKSVKGLLASPLSQKLLTLLGILPELDPLESH